MKQLKKLLSLLCVAAMLLAMLTACSGSSSSAPAADAGADDGNTGTSAPADSGSNEEVVEIVWMVGGNSPNQTEDVIRALNEKSAADIGVTVDFRFQTSDSTAVLAVLSAGDSDVDLVFSCNWFADYRSSANNNYFMDLTNLLPELAPALWEKIPTQLWEGMRVNGNIYGVPTWKDSAETQFWIGEIDVLEDLDATEDFYNADVRLDSMTPVLEKIRDWMAESTKNLSAEGGTSPIVMDKRGDWSIKIEWDSLAAQDLEIGVKNFGDANPTVQWMYDDAEFVEDLKTLKKWADTGISNGIAAAQLESVPRGVISRGIGWDGAQYTVWGGDAVGYNTVLAPAGGPFLKSSAALGSANCIPLNAKHVEATLKYLEYINTNAEYRNMLAYGIEGVNYEEVDGRYRALNGDWVAPNYTMASFDMLLAPVEVPDADMYKTICDGVNTAPTNTLTGFTPDLSSVQNEIAACSSITAEYAYALHRGDVEDVDAAIEEYRAAMEKLGLQTIIDELQRQVDEFVASK